MTDAFEPLPDDVVEDIRAYCGVLRLFSYHFQSCWPLPTDVLEAKRGWIEADSKHLGYERPEARWLTDAGQLESVRIRERVSALLEQNDPLVRAVYDALWINLLAKMDSVGQQTAVAQSRLPRGPGVRNIPSSHDKALDRFVAGGISEGEMSWQLQTEAETVPLEAVHPNQMRFVCTARAPGRVAGDRHQPNLCWEGTLEFDEAEIAALDGIISKYTGPCPRCGAPLVVRYAPYPDERAAPVAPAPVPPPPPLKVVHLEDLGTRQLLAPIAVVLEPFADGFTATWSWSGIEECGDGDTEAEAIDELKRSIVSLADTLWDAPDDSLGGDVRRDKYLLRATLCPPPASHVLSNPSPGEGVDETDFLGEKP